MLKTQKVLNNVLADKTSEASGLIGGFPNVITLGCVMKLRKLKMARQDLLSVDRDFHAGVEVTFSAFAVIMSTDDNLTAYFGM